MVPAEFTRAPPTAKAWPVNVNVPEPLWVRLLNAPAEAPPSKFCAPLLVNVTVFEPGLKVPPVFVQSPATLNAPDGAVSVPVPERLTLPLLTGPVEPVKAPLETLRLPVLTMPPAAVKVPPLTVNPPVNVSVPAPARE